MKVPWKEPWRCHRRSLEGAMEGAMKVPWKEPWRCHETTWRMVVKPLGAWWCSLALHLRTSSLFGTPSEDLKSHMTSRCQWRDSSFISWVSHMMEWEGALHLVTLCCMCFHSWRMALTWLCFVMLQASYACVLLVKDDITLMSVRVVISNT
jgi:hypothetical protein